MKRIDLDDNSMLSLFSNLETDILNYLWKHGEMRSRTLFKKMKDTHKCTHSTIAVTLDRLFKKGILERSEETCRGGKRYIYIPKFSKEGLGLNIADKFLVFLGKSFGESCVMKFKTKLR